MRVDCHKEVTSLRDQLSFFRGSHGPSKGMRYIDVRYFDASDLVDRDMRAILDEKIKYIKSKYESALIDLEQVNNR